MTKTPRQLILSEEPVHRMQWKRPVPSSGVAVVGKTPDGRYETITQFGLMTRYRLRFEVDVADHHDIVKCPLPSRGDVFSFDGTLVLDWRVTDAAVVVERKIGDGLSLCYARLHERLRHISREFDVEDCARAESKINKVIGTALPMSLPEGITIHRFSAQLNMDDGTLKAILELRTARHEGSLAAIKSGGEQEVQKIEQEGSLRRQEQRIEAVRAAMRGNYDLVAIHLSQHPDDTGSLINMIRSDYQTSEERRDRMIMEMLKRDLIQDIDVVGFNSALLGTAAERFRSGSQHTITLPHLPALPSAPTSSTNAPLVVPNTTTGDDRVQRTDTSGVVGWRQLPRREEDDAHD
ncbi:MAG: hypothetical protein ACRDRX_14440 [Pseudonocardiaceae bacterium]